MIKTSIKRNHRIICKRVTGYTLTEILVVLIIIGILVLLVLPNLLPLITKAKSLEAKTQLTHLQTLEQAYFYEHSKYSKDLTEIGYIQEKLVSDGGKANYRLEITDATNSSFTAKATAVVDFNGNGSFNVWQINENKDLKEVTPD